MLQTRFWLKLYGHRRQSVPGDINEGERCFWGLFRFLYGGFGSVHALCCVRFRRGFVNG